MKFMQGKLVNENFLKRTVAAQPKHDCRTAPLFEKIRLPLPYVSANYQVPRVHAAICRIISAKGTPSGAIQL